MREVESLLVSGLMYIVQVIQGRTWVAFPLMSNSLRYRKDICISSHAADLFLPWIGRWTPICHRIEFYCTLVKADIGARLGFNKEKLWSSLKGGMLLLYD